MDLLGFQKQVIFSSFCARLIFGAGGHEIVYDAAAAYNRAMHQFVFSDDRFLGVAAVPMQNF